MATIFTQTGDTTRWAARFETLRARHPYGHVLRDLEADLETEDLYISRGGAVYLP